MWHAESPKVDLRHLRDEDWEKGSAWDSGEPVLVGVDHTGAGGPMVLPPYKGASHICQWRVGQC